ncbi:MAG: hypothetical protein J6N72_09675 [Psychrobacter sp.]|nr:hypothetical protein [Psychrobacter sp.]
MSETNQDAIKAQLQKFLNGNTGEITPTLAKQVIAQFGGEDSFLENYAAVVEAGMGGRVGKFKKKADTVEFFNDNFDEIKATLMNMAENYGVDSGIALLIDNAPVKAEHKLNSDDVAQAFFAPLVSHDDSTDKRVKLCHWVSQDMAKATCQAFDDFIHDRATW